MKRYALCLALCASFASPADLPTLRGYSADSSKSEHDWEAKFRAIPDTGNLRDYMQRLSARPHHVGSPYDKANAEWILSKFKEWGLDASIESFDVLFPTPKERIVELVEPTHFTARLAEPTVAGDATSGQHDEQLPSYNAYSIDGDVTAPLVYVNFGIPEDYEALDQRWPARGDRMDEQLDIIDGLCAGDYFDYHGAFYELAPVKICPVPATRIPILVGGHAPAALERAARWDGWLHAGSEQERLPEMVESVLSMRRRLGRDREPFEIHVISIDGYSVDGCRRLEELGVTDVIIGFRDAYRPGPDTETLAVKLDAIARFGDSVIAGVKG